MSIYATLGSLRFACRDFPFVDADHRDVALALLPRGGQDAEIRCPAARAYNRSTMLTMAVQLTRRRFTVHEYYEMARAGILSEDDRVELIEGEIVQVPPIGPGHAGSTGGIAEQLTRQLGDRAHVRSQSPIRLDRYNEPEPDLAVLRRRADFYRGGHPTPADVFLLIEVADMTLAADVGVKMPLYARAGIPEAWVVDLRHDLVLVHREPTPEGYRLISSARRGERLSPLAFPDCELAVDDLLG